MPEKIYCYVDETGVHDKGFLFIVSSVIVPASEVSVLSAHCDNAERNSGKRYKWTTTPRKLRWKYLNRIHKWPMNFSRGYFRLTQFSQKYDELKVKAIVDAIKLYAENYSYTKATIIVDGDLEPEQISWMSKEIRNQGIRVKKLRGMRDESSCEIRLADSLCGVARAAFHEDEVFKGFLQRAIQKGYLIRIMP